MVKAKTKKMLQKLYLWLVIIGGLNWGLTLFEFNLVEWLAEFTWPIVGTIIYSAVAISALILALQMFGIMKKPK